MAATCLKCHHEHHGDPVCSFQTAPGRYCKCRARGDLEGVGSRGVHEPAAPGAPVSGRTPVPSPAFRRRRFSGNPPIAPYRYGWIVRLGRPATADERAWLKAHRYTFAGGKWCRADREAS